MNRSTTGQRPSNSLLGFALFAISLLAVGCISTPAPTPLSSLNVATPADATQTLDAELPLDPKIRLGRLDDGLRYYVRENRRPEARAELRLLVDAGSVLEDDDQQGLAHFVEHMAFNGTRHFDKQQLVDYLERIGTRFGADLNAYTSFDETVYKLRVPTDDPELLERGLQILADWAGGVVFDAEEVENERGVLVEEWRQGRGARARVFDQQLPVLLHGSRYAERLPIGRLGVIESASPEAIRRFYRDWYRPNLMAVVAVGDFASAGLAVDDVEALIRETFGAGTAGAATRLSEQETPEQETQEQEAPKETSERPRYPIPPHPGTLTSLVTDPELSQTTVEVLYKHPPRPEGTYGDYRRALVQSLHHAMLNDRLAELAREPAPPFLYGVAGLGSFTRSGTFYTQRVGVPDGEALRGLEALLREVERVDRHGFTDSELERAKTGIRQDYEQAFRERDKTDSARLANELGRHFLEGEPVPGIAKERALVERFLPTIGLAEVDEAARRWITDENRAILISGPEKDDAPLPEESEILAVFDEVDRSELRPFIDRTLDEPLLADLPAPGEIVEERALPEIGVTEWRLGNGVRAVAKPTDFQNDQILLGAFSPGGHSLVADEAHASASLATAIVAESGLGEFDKTELGKALAGELAVVQAHISELEEGLRGSASPDDLETLLQLVYMTFTEPRLDREAFESFLTRFRTSITNRDSRPTTAYQDQLAETMSRGHPRRRPFDEEFLDDVDADEAFRVYRDRFADASDFTFVLVGSLDPEALRPLVKTYLATLPATGRDESWRDVGVRPPDGVTRFEVKGGLEPRSQVDLHFFGPGEWNREEAHRLSSLAQLLRMRLRETLREELAGTYGVRVAGSLTWRPVGQYQLGISFGCSPDAVDRLVEAVFDEIEALREHGIEESYVEKIREIQRRRRETDLETNAFWLQGLESYYAQDLDPTLLLDFDALVEGVTAESLQSAARRYLNRERYVLGVLKPGDSN